jgi:plasmid stabilization system protein ParE
LRDRSELIEEAEILTDSWAAAQNNHRQLELSTALQILLSEHEEICRQIIEIIDAGKTRRVVWRRDPLATLSG